MSVYSNRELQMYPQYIFQLQFKFFAEVSEKALKPSDAVIIVNHEPHWVTRQSDSKHERHVQELMDTYLSGKVRIRLAGDLHHYTRHTPVQSIQNSTRSRSRSVSWDGCNDRFMSTTAVEENHPELIVSGGGGAFCHGTRELLDKSSFYLPTQ